ncbi:leukocyte immunoglobulin-like receptor subfamily A member 6 [Peromyscus californicus insignis]|uniref:leukocyte immunoglobulin-like receptor subfamily A member 6 n=1 Tax=Peromyscus californicus insignis TaxID=564181 RepID=UPI0022A76280|nr:leukocyte immunoglobulin-like receptor subfamily A member 6 [Peromyscus californicus insignis]
MPSNVVTIGKQVTLLCEGPLDAQEYHFYKEGKPHSQVPTAHEDTEKKDKIFISSIKSNDAGQYQCYFKSRAGTSEHSDTLELVVTGFYIKPTLFALPNPIVALGGYVTLLCISHEGYNRFILIKDKQFSSSMDSQYVYDGLSPARFEVGPITFRERWSFRCYGYHTSKPQVWSEGSDILELLVSGFYYKPTLSALPIPVVTLGGSVTLSCTSKQRYDRFILIRYKQFSSSMNSKYVYTGQSPAMFQVGPVTLSERWSFRCYGYYSGEPHVLSKGSDILELLVSGEQAPGLNDIEHEAGFSRRC